MKLSIFQIWARRVLFLIMAVTVGLLVIPPKALAGVGTPRIPAAVFMVGPMLPPQDAHEPDAEPQEPFPKLECICEVDPDLRQRIAELCASGGRSPSYKDFLPEDFAELCEKPPFCFIEDMIDSDGFSVRCNPFGNDKYIAFRYTIRF